MKVLRIARAARRQSLQDISAATGINIATLSKIERGRVTATLDQKTAILKLFPGYDESKLFADLALGPHESIFSLRSIPPETSRQIDGEVAQRMTQFRAEIRQKNEASKARGIEAVLKFNKRTI